MREMPRVISAPDEVGTEILLHINGIGDRRHVEAGWAGKLGSRCHVEAISIRTRGTVQPTAVEFCVVTQGSRTTAWVGDGSYVGTVGQPLTGFAARPVTTHRDKLDIVYEGCFFAGRIVGLKRNGELCVSAFENDPLEALRVSIFRRATD